MTFEPKAKQQTKPFSSLPTRLAKEKKKKRIKIFCTVPQVSNIGTSIQSFYQMKKGIMDNRQDFYLYNIADRSLTTPCSGKGYRERAIGNHGVNKRHLSSPLLTGIEKTGMALVTSQDQSCMKKLRLIYYRPIMRNQFEFELSFFLLFLFRRLLSH